MNRKSNIIITMVLAGLFVRLVPLCAQDYKQVINNPLYYWGEGYGMTLEEADQQALSTLMSSISVNISQSFDIHNDRIEKNGEVEKDVLTSEGVIMSYSAATLSNTTMQIVKNQPDAHVVRWILKSEVEKVFASRQEKITEYPLAELNQCVLNPPNWFVITVVDILQSGQRTDFANNSSKQPACIFSIVPDDKKLVIQL